MHLEPAKNPPVFRRIPPCILRGDPRTPDKCPLEADLAVQKCEIAEEHV